MQKLAVMPAPAINDILPENLKDIRTWPMFVMRLDVANPPLVVSQTPDGYRRTSIIRGGFFEGERLSGRVLRLSSTSSCFFGGT